MGGGAASFHEQRTQVDDRYEYPAALVLVPINRFLATAKLS